MDYCIGAATAHSCFFLRFAKDKTVLADAKKDERAILQ